MNVNQLIKNKKGFTLVELMAAVAVTFVVMGAVFSLYTNQRKIHKRQEAVVDMQQNARAGLYLISQEIRMAGYDPLGISGASIVAVAQNPTSIRYTRDITDNPGTATDGDGDTNDANEDITIAFDNVNDGVACTANNPCIVRDFDGPGGGNPQPFINNVDFFELVYTLDDGTITRNPPAASLGDIRTIQINMLIRASNPEPELDTTLINFDIPPTEIYESRFDTANPLPGILAGTNVNLPADSFRRRLVSATIQCRNASL